MIGQRVAATLQLGAAALLLAGQAFAGNLVFEAPAEPVVVAEAVVATEAATPNSEQIPCPTLSTKWPRLAAW